MEKKINIDNGLYKTVLWYIDNKTYFKTLNKQDIINRFGEMIKKELYYLVD